MRIIRKSFLTAAVVAAALLAATAPKPSAQASTHPSGRLVAGTVLTTRLSPAPGGTASPKCAPRLGHFNRTQACWKDDFTLLVFNKQGDLVGTVEFTMDQSIQLQVKSRSFTEQLTVTSVTPIGETPAGLEMPFKASCDSSCHATNHFPEGSPLEAGTAGSVSYRDSVAARKMHSDSSHYSLSLTAPNFTPGDPFTWRTPIFYRCDDVLNGQGAGCVFPGFGSTLTSMTELPDIAKNIRRIQTKGPGHYGRPGSGHPLHRLVNSAKQRKNQQAVCGRSVVGPPPKGKSCDEYPFASTYEGGTALSKANRGWAWVPASQQNMQGPRVKNFYYANRILDHDPFWVKV